VNSSRNKNALLHHAIDDNKDRVESVGGRKSLNEIHGYGVPRKVGDRKLLEHAVGFVALRFRAHTSGTGFAILLDKVSNTRPSVVPLYKTEGLVLSGMSSEDVVMLVAEDVESEVVRVRDIDATTMAEETVGVYGPVRFWVLQMVGVDWIRRKSPEDIGV
jgi:hypothetical protein